MAPQIVLRTSEIQQKVDIGKVEAFILDLPEKAWELGWQILFTVLFFLIGTQVIKVIRKIIKKSLKKANAEIGVIQFLDSFIKATLYIILIFLIASNFGVTSASIVALLGSAGVAIGLAVQGSLSNFAGGVLILLLKPFKVGDYISSSGYEGTVSEIQMFYTKLLSVDNQTIILPNGALANSNMTNVTAAKERRLDIKIGISYEADIKKAKEVLLQILKNNPDTLKDKEIFVYVDNLGEHAVIIGLRCWFLKENFWNGKWKINEDIKYALEQAGIKIPYSQLEVHLKTEK